MITTDFEQIVKHFLARECTTKAKIIRIPNTSLYESEQIRTDELTDEAKDPYNYISMGSQPDVNHYQYKRSPHEEFLYELTENYVSRWLVPYVGSRSNVETEQITEQTFREYYRTGILPTATMPKPNGGHFEGDRPVKRVHLEEYLKMKLTWKHYWKYVGKAPIYKPVEGDVYQIVDLSEGEKEFDLLKFIADEKSKA